MLTYNEPDLPGPAGSKVSVEAAVDSWQVIRNSGLRIGSPAAANALKTWFSPFDEKTRGNYDFLAVHWYSHGNADPNALVDFDSEVHTQYHRKPIWITEFGLANFDGKAPFTASDTTKFIEGVVPLLDARPFVERYFYHDTDPDSPASLFDVHGKVNAAGRAYAGTLSK